MLSTRLLVLFWYVRPSSLRPPTHSCLIPCQLASKCSITLVSLISFNSSHTFPLLYNEPFFALYLPFSTSNSYFFTILNVFKTWNKQSSNLAWANCCWKALRSVKSLSAIIIVTMLCQCSLCFFKYLCHCLSSSSIFTGNKPYCHNVALPIPIFHQQNIEWHP